MWSILVGAVVAVVTGGIGTWYGSKREHRSWLRDIRRQAYAEFSSALTGLETELLAQSLRDKIMSEIHAEIGNPEVLRAVDAIINKSREGWTTQTLTEQIKLIIGALGSIEIAGPQEVHDAAFKYYKKVMDRKNGQAEQQAFVHAARRALDAD